MFDETLRRLRQLDGENQISIPVALDDDGYLDRACPSEDCAAEFKVLLDDWKGTVADEKAYCPLCRAEATAQEFSTTEQTEYARDAAVAFIQNQIGGALALDARRFNSRPQRGSLIKLSLDVKHSPAPQPTPPDPSDLMRQRFVCEQCGCRYTSIGAAFFCPACGHNSATSMFEQTIASVRSGVSHLAHIEASLDRDEAANLRRMVLEGNVEKLVGAFQRCLEAMFLGTPRAGGLIAPKNVFQRLNDGSDLWQRATGKRYDDHITTVKLAELKTFFQQRHLLAHQQGIVDQEYITKSGDSSYAVGQRLVIKPDAVRRMADLVDFLVSAIRADL